MKYKFSDKEKVQGSTHSSPALVPSAVLRKQAGCRSVQRIRWGLGALWLEGDFDHGFDHGFDD